VFSTDRALNKTVLLLKETAPVSKIAYGHNDDVWVATSRPVVEAWRGATSADFEKGTSDHVDYDKPLSTKPIFQIKGSPGLVKQALVNSKSKLITADSTGQLESWDILTVKQPPLEYRIYPCLFFFTGERRKNLVRDHIGKGRSGAERRRVGPQLVCV